MLWDRFPPEGRLLLTALCVLVGLRPAADDDGNVLWNKTARVLMGAPSLPALREFKEGTLQELDIFKDVKPDAVAEVGKMDMEMNSPPSSSPHESE